MNLFCSQGWPETCAHLSLLSSCVYRPACATRIDQGVLHTGSPCPIRVCLQPHLLPRFSRHHDPRCLFIWGETVGEQSTAAPAWPGHSTKLTSFITKQCCPRNPGCPGLYGLWLSLACLSHWGGAGVTSLRMSVPPLLVMWPPASDLISLFLIRLAHTMDAVTFRSG